MSEQFNSLQEKTEAWRAFILKPLLQRNPFTANDITTFRLVLALAFPFLILSFPILAWIFIFVSIFLDAIDGPIARFKKSDTDRGKFIDVLVDQITFVLLTLGLIKLLPDLSLVLATLSFLIPLTYLITIIYKNENKPSTWLIKSKTHLTVYKIIFLIIVISYLTEGLSKESIWLLLWLEVIASSIHFSIYYIAFINKGSPSSSHPK